MDDYKKESIFNFIFTMIIATILYVIVAMFSDNTGSVLNNFYFDLMIKWLKTIGLLSIIAIAFYIIVNLILVIIKWIRNIIS
jgi:hypothetical protein